MADHPTPLIAKTFLSFAEYTKVGTSPAIPLLSGLIIFKQKEVAAAASIALPPCSKILIPAKDDK